MAAGPTFVNNRLCISRDKGHDNKMPTQLCEKHRKRLPFEVISDVPPPQHTASDATDYKHSIDDCQSLTIAALGENLPQKGRAGYAAHMMRH